MNDQKSKHINDEAEPSVEEFEFKERKRWLFFGLPFTFTMYTLSVKKLSLQVGLLTTVVDDILLYRIMDTSLRRTLFQKIFGLGDVRVASSDQSHPELVIHNIRNASQFKERMDEQIEKERLRMRFRTGEYMDTDEEPDDDGQL
jgi:uncharacterized membrane protein YdbT with pleckstrin-like domain